MSDGPYRQTANEARHAAGLWRRPARALVLQASPRGARGVTEQVAQCLLEGLSAEVADARLVRLAELKAEPCRGCFKCWTNADGRCPINDDLAGLIDELPGLDLLVWATPLYVEGLPAQLKALVDRMMVLNHPSIFMDGERCIHPCRHESMPDLAVAAVAGFYGEDTFAPLLTHLRALAIDQHMPLLAFWPRPDSLSLMHPQGRETWKDVAEALRQAAQGLAREGTSPPAPTRAAARPLLPRAQYLELAQNWWKGR